jgi:hypothetical protein
VSCHVSWYQSICSCTSMFPWDYWTVRNQDEEEVQAGELLYSCCDYVSSRPWRSEPENRSALKHLHSSHRNKQLTRTLHPVSAGRRTAACFGGKESTDRPEMQDIGHGKTQEKLQCFLEIGPKFPGNSSNASNALFRQS